MFNPVVAGLKVVIILIINPNDFSVFFLFMEIVEA